MADDETTEIDAAKAAAADAEQALEAVETEAATELPAGESTETPATAAAPGKTFPVGSGFMMLTAGIEAMVNYRRL